MIKKSYAKRHSWRISFRAATPVANWRSGSAAYVPDLHITTAIVLVYLCLILCNCFGKQRKDVQDER